MHLIVSPLVRTTKVACIFEGTPGNLAKWPVCDACRQEVGNRTQAAILSPSENESGPFVSGYPFMEDAQPQADYSSSISIRFPILRNREAA